ncbi:MAG: gliding motility-associated C-terminal domain-containing protein, partial [Paludibacter sp.]|nr:gliding motility-associated C-terminal domain-containing protein [Paludibacter sp.]
AKVTVNPTPKIHDYYLKILTGTSFTLQPENGETLNGITNIVPVGTKYSWIIDNINPVGAIQGATVVTLPRDTIIQTLTNNTKGNAVITYKVIPVSSTCNGDTFTVVVSVVPPKATVNPENIKCFGNNDGKITINNIVGIIGSNNPLVTCVRPIDNSSFTPSIITQDSVIFTGLSSGRYVITINDAQSLGIPFKDTVDIFEPERIDLQIISKKNINCYGIYNGEINLTVVPRLIGSNNYTYNWYYSTNSADWTAYTTNIHDPLKLKNLAGGYFYLKITDVNGCSASTPVIRIVEPQPFYFNADVVDAHDCDNVYSGSITNIQFGGGTVLTDNDYKFSFRHNTNFYPNLNITGLKAYLSAMQPGTYEITMTDIFNCTPLVKQFTIKRPDPLEVTINSRINFDCANNKTTQVNNAVVSGGIPLVDNQGKMYYNIQWKAGNEVVGTGETFINIKSGEFINIEVTDKRGCKFSGNVSFISKLPELSWTDTLLNCNTRRYRFTAIVKNDLTQNYTFIWKFGNVDRVTTAPVLDYNFPTEGNYTVQLIIFRKDGLCEFPFSKNILVQSPPNLVIRQVEGGQWNDEKKEVRFCKGESVKVYIDGANSYYWSVDGSTKSFVTITEQGDYFVEGKTISGCAAVLNFKALYNTYNYSIITDKDNPLKNNEVQLNFTNTTVTFWTQVIAGSSYTWDFGDGTPTENGFKKPHTYNVSSSNYFDVQLQVINPDGCKEVATKRIWITAENLPNTITPNGDGINDVFMAGWKIQIFNRNGILLYQGTGGWDGTYNGKPVSNGTYFYILIYSSLDSPQTKTGFVTVIR